MSIDDDWVTVDGVRYVPEAPLKAEIARLRAALDEILSLQPLKTQHEHYIAMLKTLDIIRKALAKEEK